MTEATNTPAAPVSIDATAEATSANSSAADNVKPNAQASGSPVNEATPNSGSNAWAGLSSDNLSIVQNKNWSDANAAVKAYGELERAFHAKTANNDLPSEANGYDFGEVKDLPEGMTYDGDFETAFKTWAHENKVGAGQAKGIRDKFVSFAKDAFGRQIAARDESIAQSKVTLTREWGPSEGPTFKRNVELATRAVEQLGLGDHLVKSGALLAGKDGGFTVVDANTVKAFTKIGETMFAEDSLYGTTASALNPWSKDSENLTLQSRIYKENPQKAKALIIASGRQEEFGYLLSRIA